MVLIHNAKLTGGPVSEDDYRFDVTYRAQFDPEERNLVFSEFVRLRESDSFLTFGDDNITSANPSTFVPGQEFVDRHFAVIVPREVADTELGHEEIYAEVWLCSPENIITDPVAAETGADRFVRTPPGDFNP